MSIERLQKILAQAGIASRRKAEEMITEGLVTVNGKTAKIGDKADFTVDHIKVNGTLLRKLEDPFYVVMNKPKGVISMMSDPEGRPTLADFLVKMKVRVNPIGRLDFNSDGLILLTNDGAMAEKIQKSDGFPRVYHVKVKGHITTEMVDRLNRGMRTTTKFVKPMTVRIHEELNKKTKIEIAFLNAANVDVKAYFEEKGFLVEKITRTSIGHITLHGLEPGAYRTVPKTKFEALVAQPELGVKAIEFRHEKEREILPRDQRMRNVDEHGKVIPKVSSVAVSSRISVGDGESRPRTPRAPKVDRIVVKADGSGDGQKTPPKKREYSSSVDMPKFKKRVSTGSAGRGYESRTGASSGGERAPRSDSRSDSRAPRSDSRGPRSDGPRFGARPSRPAAPGRDGKPRFSPRGEGRPEGRGPRADSRGGRSDSRGGPRSDSRGGARGGRSDSRGPRSEVSRGASFDGPRARPSSKLAPRAGRPITRVKRRET